MAVERQQAPDKPGPAVGERVRPQDPTSGGVYSTNRPGFKPGTCAHCGGFKSVDMDGDPVCGLCGRYDFVGLTRIVTTPLPLPTRHEEVPAPKISPVEPTPEPKPVAPIAKIRAYIRATKWNISWSE